MIKIANKLFILSLSLIVIVLLSSIIACFAFAQNTQAEVVKSEIVYVDEVGRILEIEKINENTKGDELKGVYKNGYTANYTLLNKYPYLPFEGYSFSEENAVETKYGTMYASHPSIVNKYYEFLERYGESLTDEQAQIMSVEFATFIYEMSGYAGWLGLTSDWGYIRPVTEIMTCLPKYNLEFIYDDRNEVRIKDFYGKDFREGGMYSSNNDFSVQEFYQTTINYNNNFLPIYSYPLRFWKNEENFYKLDIIAGITKASYTKELYSLTTLFNEALPQYWNEGKLYVRVNYEERIEPPNEPTTNPDEPIIIIEDSKFIQFFTENWDKLTEQYTALSKGDINTALKSGWQIYAINGAVLLILLCVTLAIVLSIKKKKPKSKTKIKPKQRSKKHDKF